MKLRILAAMAAFATLAAGAASAAILTFDDLTGGVSFSNGSELDYNGFTFSGSARNYVWYANSPNSNGTTNLIGGYSSTLTIARSDGGLFNFTGADLAISWYNANPAQSIIINGVSIGLTQTLTSLDFSFFGVDSISIVGFRNGYWTGDNFRLSAVPVPASLPLLAAGLVGLRIVARRKRKAA